MGIKYMLACIFMSMGPAKHEKVAIFYRKMSGFRMFESILIHSLTYPTHPDHQGVFLIRPAQKRKYPYTAESFQTA